MILDKTVEIIKILRKSKDPNVNSIKLPCQVRWNSIYLMFSDFKSKFKTILKYLKQLKEDEGSESILKSDDMKIFLFTTPILKELYDITKKLEMKDYF